MTERNLMKQIRAIVYEDQANRRKINDLITIYELSKASLEISKESDLILEEAELKKLLILCSAETFGINPDAVLIDSRKTEAARARHFIMYYYKLKHPRMSWLSVAETVDKKHHSNAIASFQLMINLLEVDKDTRQKWERFNQLVDDRLNK